MTGFLPRRLFLASLLGVACAPRAVHVPARYVFTVEGLPVEKAIPILREKIRVAARGRKVTTLDLEMPPGVQYVARWHINGLRLREIREPSYVEDRMVYRVDVLAEI